jgi:hypothetical protein
VADIERWPSNEVLYARRWSVCCDFHDDPKDIQEHLAEIQKQYGFTKDGKPIIAPKGWKILPFREIVPEVHREYDKFAGWCFPRRCCGTMTPIYATVSGWVLAFAVPE